MKSASIAPPVHHTVSRNAPSCTMVFVLCASVLSLAGLVIYSFVGVSTVDPEEAAQLLILSLGVLQPEANERYTYMALTVMAPLVIWISVKFFARLGLRETTTSWLTPLLLGAGILVAIPLDVFRAAFLKNALIAAVGIAAIFVIACKFDKTRMRAAATSIFDRVRTQKRETHRTVVISLCGLSVGLTLAWRIFGDASAYAMLDHFDAFFYSVVQSYYGGTCLGDVLPQYGCYGEILAPVLKPFGLSVLTMTAVMALLSGAGLCATMVFAGRLIRSPMILAMAGCWVLITQNRPVWTSIPADPYFQYTPLRTLFPALSLLVVYWWQRRRAPLKAMLIGAFSGLSICWNLDSGAAVAIALFCFIIISGATSSRFSWRSLRTNLTYGALHVLGLLLAIAGFGVWLTIKYGQPPHLADYLAFVRIFYVLGFFMLPMSIPDAWVAAVACVLLVLVRFAIRMETGPYAPRLERAAYLALLAMGLFSYFNGRSHPVVFLYVSWPFVLLLGYLLDSWRPSGAAPQDRVTRGMLTALTVGAFFIAIANVSIGIPRAVAIGIKSWRQILQHEANAVFQPQVDFIRSASSPSAHLSVMAVYQSVLLAEVGQRSALPGPGLVETVRRRDAEMQIQALVDHGPQHLFIGKEAVEGKGSWNSAAPWVFDNMPAIKRAYDVDRWSPDGALLHLVRKPRTD
ncbi:hypothetical protein [Bradyrhizobium sp.]|uniref:hypothetical protein n=1 Tax=Bradyrhizobium sp. TaxID=376 RepID=UPI0039E4E896